MTTHYMDEAEHCDRIAIIDHGQIVALDTPAALKARVGGDIVTVRTSDNARASEKLKAFEGIQMRPGPDGVLIIETTQGDRFIPRMMDAFSNDGTPVVAESISLSHPTLEDVFIKLTGHRIRAEEASSTHDLRQQIQIWRGGARRR